MMPNFALTLLVYVLFAVSGFAGLIYESIWSRYLKLLLGHASYGQILTLVIYMGGLGLGSYLFGKLVKHSKHPFRLYALLELAIGLGGVFYHYLYDSSMRFFFDAAAGKDLPMVVLVALKLLLAIVTTAPWAILLGGTFPCLAVGMMRLLRDQGRGSLPWLYFTNSLGGAAGIVTTSYLFVPRLGTIGTLSLVGMLNILIAFVFYTLAKYGPQPETLEKPSSPQAALPPEADTMPSFPPHFLPLLLATSALTGLSSFFYEVGWIRLLSLLLGSSTHSFDVMISAFILGLALGGLCARAVLAKGKQIWVALGVIQVLMGLLAGLSLKAYPWLYELVDTSHLVLQNNLEAYGIYSAFKYLLCLFLMFPASFCAGMTLPLITWLILKGQQQDEKWVGYVYAWNTLGAILGASIGGLFLLPLLQLKWFLLTGGLIDLALGGWLLWVAPLRRSRLAIIAALSVLAFLPAVFSQLDHAMMASGVFRAQKSKTNLATLKESEIIIRHGRTATVSVIKGGDKTRIATNGKTDASLYMGSTPQRGTLDESTQASLAIYPMHLMKTPYQAAVIGMGSGMTAHYLLADPLLEKLDLIEIEPEMYKQAHHFLPWNQRIFESPKAHVHFDDAKTFFFNQPHTYDLIVSEPSNPWVSGVSGLFTSEFYQDIRRFLKPEGYLVQWMHSYEFNSELFLSILKALSEHFPEFRIYGVPSENFHTGETALLDVIIVAGQKPFQLDQEARVKSIPGLAKELERVQTKLEEFGEQHFIVSKTSLAPLLKVYSPNSDYFPIVDYGAEKSFFLKSFVDFYDMFLGSISYQLLFEPEFMALEQNRLSKLPHLPQELENTHQQLQQALQKGPSPNLDEQFFKNLFRVYPYLNWQASKMANLYRQRLQKWPVELKYRQAFELLTALKTQPDPQVRLAIQRFLAEASAPETDIKLLRVLVIHTLKKDWMPEYKLLTQKFMLPNPKVQKVEKQYLTELPASLAEATEASGY